MPRKLSPAETLEARAKEAAKKMAPGGYSRKAIDWKKLLPFEDFLQDRELALMELLNNAYIEIGRLEERLATVERNQRYNRK